MKLRHPSSDNVKIEDFLQNYEFLKFNFKIEILETITILKILKINFNNYQNYQNLSKLVTFD